MDKFYLEPAITKPQAWKSVHEQKINLVAKAISFFHGKKDRLVSMELLYLPYWSFDYSYIRKGMKEPIEGKIALETYTGDAAILPVKTKLEPLESQELCLPVYGQPINEAAKKAVYWEAFVKEKKHKNAEIEILKASVLYVPYYVGYSEGAQIDITLVDATNGKIDTKLKDSVLYGMMKMEKRNNMDMVCV
ncbi:hypothetical protein [Evansella clarkii]|uniref:hypothetical protein n=1 Tax=Evansella clarkii TaxID=79879 RepID=UPI000B436070|nr:hypothetical protein [Evansella clarkii]